MFGLSAAAIGTAIAEAAAVAGEIASSVGAGMAAALPEALGGASGAIGAGTTAGAGTAAGAGAAAAAGAGGISAGAGGIAGSIGAGITGIGEGALLGSGLGAATSAATGGDVGKGALMGAATGAIGGGLSSAVGEIGAGMGAAADTGGTGSTVGSTTSEIAPAAKDAGSTVGSTTIAERAPLGKAVPFLDETVPNSINVSPMRLAGGPTAPTGGITSVGADMTPAELASTIRAPTASADLGSGSYGSNTEAINAVNANTPATAPSASTTPFQKAFNYIKDNPGDAMMLGGTAMSLMGRNPQPKNAPEPVYPYTPSTYTPPPIQKTTVPQYYNPTGGYGYTGYAEGGAVDSAQPNGSMNGAQPNGPMNPIVARAMQSIQAQQPQQQSQAPSPQPLAQQGIMAAQAQPIGQPMQQQPMGQPMQMGQPIGGITQPTQMAARGGMMRDNLGGYSHGGIAGLTSAVGSGVSDEIPAQIGTSGRQPARLAANEFVIPARAVSELGQGSSEAGAKQLQAMVDRIQAGRKKSIGKGKIAVDSKAIKHLPA
jgi:hypothetical protein